MIQTAEGTAIGDKTQVKANTATAPAPHLPVPVAALNPRQFVPPLSLHASQSLPREKERRRNETRLRAPWHCRHFRPHIWRGGAERGKEVGCLPRNSSQRTSCKCKGASHWWARRKRVSSAESNVLRKRVLGTQSKWCCRAWADGVPAGSAFFLPPEKCAARSRQVWTGSGNCAWIAGCSTCGCGHRRGERPFGLQPPPLQEIALWLSWSPAVGAQKQCFGGIQSYPSRSSL